MSFLLYTVLRNTNVSWTSMFVTTVLQEKERPSDVAFLVQIFWTDDSQNPCALDVTSKKV